MQKATQFDVLGYSAFKEMTVYALNLKSGLGKRKNSMESLREKSGDLSQQE